MPPDQPRTCRLLAASMLAGCVVVTATTLTVRQLPPMPAPLLILIAITLAGVLTLAAGWIIAMIWRRSSRSDHPDDA